ncbi:MAG: hypothetical protein CVV24_01650 [Ignavibacteriae bacterium HGW-Ignavibacteriae-3]|nr:MAG: hypothetical protein CVV24_01650 [Ignavibacteriae bacterium HGW-Ignavibacteriae-3]
MKRNSSATLRPVYSLFLFALASMLIFSCESSRVGPELPAPNPPVPPAQPLVLSGFVKDASNLTAINGATIRISNAGGTVLTSILTDNTGKYAYDVTNLNDNTLNLAASKAGYGFNSERASIEKESNSAAVGDILLSKVVSTSATVTPASGGTVSAPAQAGVSTAPVTVSVPPNAVSSNVVLSAAPISIAQVPAPADANTAILGAAQFGPSGTVFNVPVTISIPLASAMTPGATFPLQLLNETTGQYTNSGFTATVNSAGTSATAPVTHFTTYTIGSAVSITANPGTAVLGNFDYYQLSSGSGTKTFVSAQSSLTLSSGQLPAATLIAWLKQQNRLGIDFGKAQSLTVGGNFPTLPSNYQVNGVQVNPNVPGSGSWSYRWYVQQRTTPYTGSVTQQGSTQSFTASYIQWVLQPVKSAANPNGKTGWYWTSHNQGGVVSGPY